MAKRKSCGGAEDSGTWFRNPPYRTSHPPRGQRTAANRTRGAGPQGLKFHTYICKHRLAGKPGGKGDESGEVVSLPPSAPTVNTLAIGNNPERVTKARTNSDIVVAR